MSGNRQRRSSGAVKKIVTAVIVLAVAVGAVFAFKAYKSKSKQASTAEASTTDTVMRGDVSLTITGSAAVEPYERYEILAKVSGDITYCPYEVGDIVEEGALLYKFDTSETDLSMQRQQLSLEQSKSNYDDALKDAEKLKITADASGVISGLNVKVGDEIKSNTTVAQISNSVILEVTLPFNATQAANISVGDAAYVSSSVHMSNVSGTVTHKSATSHAGADGSRLVDITITFENPGAFSEGMTVGGAIGSEVSPGSGEVKLSDSGNATAEAEGTVTKIYYKNGDYVQKGAVVAEISSDSVANSIRSSKNSYETAKLSMQDAQEQLDDYNLTAPISGTVITKNSKAGDTIDKSNSSQTLMVIADVSKLKFSMEIDELDVSKVSTGQRVDITCDALPDETFAGEITNLSVEGTSSNGVTTYTAEVVINEPGNLRPSMNVDASVVAQSSTDTLYVPSEDVKTLGNMYYVYKKSDGASSDKEQQDAMPPMGERPEGMPERGERPEGMDGEMPARGERPEGATGEATQTGEKPAQPSSDTGKQQNTENGGARQGGGRLPQAPDGFETVIVTVGVIGDEYTEILSGLSEGDEVYAQTSSSSSTTNNMMMGRGGMPGSGGMPGGGGMGGPGGGGGMRR